MSKLAICVKSCNRDRDRGCHDAIRSTWGRDLKAYGIDLFFFMGRDPAMDDTRQLRRYVSGEIVLDCKDDYMGLPYKTRRICQWATGKTFPYLFLCDVDTFINPKLLLASTGYQSYDYSGIFSEAHPPGCPPFTHTDHVGTYTDMYPWASGGWGYFLSRRAYTVVGEQIPNLWAEDMWVGQALGPEIEKKQLTIGQFQPRSGSWHFLKTEKSPEFKPEFMKMAYERGSWDPLYVEGKL